MEGHRPGTQFPSALLSFLSFMVIPRRLVAEETGLDRSLSPLDRTHRHHHVNGSGIDHECHVRIRENRFSRKD